MANGDDFDVDMIAYNRHITQRMIEMKLEYGGRASIGQLVKKMGRDSSSYKLDGSSKEQEIRGMVGLRVKPTEEDGAWKPAALALAKILGTEPDTLWPGELKHRIPSSNSRFFTARIGQPVQWMIMDKTP